MNTPGISLLAHQKNIDGVDGAETNIGGVASFFFTSNSRILCTRNTKQTLMVDGAVANIGGADGVEARAHLIVSDPLTVCFLMFSVIDYHILSAVTVT